VPFIVTSDIRGEFRQIRASREPTFHIPSVSIALVSPQRLRARD